MFRCSYMVFYFGFNPLPLAGLWWRPFADTFCCGAEFERLWLWGQEGLLSGIIRDRPLPLPSLFLWKPANSCPTLPHAAHPPADSKPNPLTSLYEISLSAWIRSLALTLPPVTVPSYSSCYFSWSALNPTATFGRLDLVWERWLRTYINVPQWYDIKRFLLY